MSSWFGVDLNTLALYFNHSATHIQSMNDGEFFDRIWLCNDEPKECAHEDLTIPVHEGVVKLNDGEKFPVFLHEQKSGTVSPMYSNIYSPGVGFGKFLPSSQRYLAQHDLNLIMLESIILKQHSGDANILLANAYTHSDGTQFPISNIPVWATDLGGNQKPQFASEFIHLNPSCINHVSFRGYVNFSEPPIDNNLTSITFISHKHGLGFKGVF